MIDAISASPLSPLQKSVVALLKGDGALTTLLGGPRIYDQPPEGEAMPYVRVGDQLSTPDNDLTSFGREVTMTLHIWTKARTNSPGQQILDRITGLLDHRPADLTVTGHRVVSIRSEFDQALTDPDPEIRHHVVRLRATTAQTA